LQIFARDIILRIIAYSGVMWRRVPVQVEGELLLHESPTVKRRVVLFGLIIMLRCLTDLRNLMHYASPGHGPLY